MNKTIFRRDESGFSLVELMIVVGIIGLLATLAIPKFQQFQAKARQAEAKNMLSHIYTLEEAYHLDNNQYIGFTEVYGRKGKTNSCTAPTGAQAIGFEISPCESGGVTPRYGYTVTGPSSTAFKANAATGDKTENYVCPGAAKHTFWIDQDRKLDTDLKEC
jgi:prepilin-type N-terminal cleavage/methylation domain-containing protein